MNYPALKWKISIFYAVKRALKRAGTKSQRERVSINKGPAFTQMVTQPSSRRMILGTGLVFLHALERLRCALGDFRILTLCCLAQVLIGAGQVALRG
jgi:hypothetical protein